MNRIRLGFSLLLTALMADLAHAQCTPVDCLDQLPAAGGLCAANFLVGRVNTPYNDAISFHVTNACTPASVFDPNLAGASIRITQLSNITFSNLSAGLSGTTNQASYTPPANGCGSISGVPTEAGVFAATVNLVVDVNVWPFSLTCGGLGPIPQNNQSITESRELIILPDPSFSGPNGTLCVTDEDVVLVPTGTAGGTFSGPGVSGNTFSPAMAGIGSHEVKYVVSAQEGAAIAPATDSLTIVVSVIVCAGACDALAGTVEANETPVCLVDGVATISATANGDAVVPDGFIQVFALTQGVDLLLVDGQDNPLFEVYETGDYTIHSFVVDPSTFDLDAVVFGESTATDILEQLIQGGGSICASLDVVGASITVEECVVPCEADAGTLSGGTTVCLEEGEASLSAVADGNAEVPAGYGTVYVLTEGAGLVIVDAGASPVFTVDATGTYTIHTLVYDPNTLDLSIVEFGVTTGFDVNGLLIQGGGSVCAGLDVAGAAFIVEICTGLNEITSGGMHVMPNPNKGDFAITFGEDALVVLELLDMSGRLVYTEQRMNRANTPMQVQLAGRLAPGTYVLRMSSELGRSEQRIVIGR